MAKGIPKIAVYAAGALILAGAAYYGWQWYQTQNPPAQSTRYYSGGYYGGTSLNNPNRLYVA